MAAPTLTVAPLATSTVGIFMPLKTPIPLEASEVCTWTAVNLPEGLSIVEGPGKKSEIVGTPTKIESKSTCKVTATNLTAEGVTSSAFKITVAEAEFNSPGGVKTELIAVDNASGALLDQVVKTAAPYKTAVLAEIQVLNGADFTAGPAPAVERLN